MMNYAPGADAPRNVHNRDVEPAPPSSVPHGFNRTSSHADGIDYSDGNTKASRRGRGEYFDLDPDTKLPVPLDEGGFFRVGIDASNPKWLWMQYRIERKFLKNFNFKWLSSREVDNFTITIGSEREIEHDDVLNAALKLSEDRQREIFRKNSVRVHSPLQKWVGDYPTKSTSITDTE